MTITGVGSRLVVPPTVTEPGFTVTATAAVVVAPDLIVRLYDPKAVSYTHLGPWQMMNIGFFARSNSRTNRCTSLFMRK